MGVAVRTVNIKQELDQLARRINQGLCILFLGPGVVRTADGTPMNVAFARHLVKKMDEEEIGYDPSQQDNMPYIIEQYIMGKNEKLGRKSYKPVDIRYEYNSFIDKNPPDFTLYDSLSKLPFQLVINTNYTKRFYEYFKKNQEVNGRKVHFDYYDFSNKEPQGGIPKIPPPGNNDFLVYNLLGLCEETTLNSMILTEPEFVRFVGRIHQPATSLPIAITNHIDESKYCLFLGFDFEQWYLKVLIRALWNGSQQDAERGENELPDTLALGMPVYPTAFFYQEAFRFYFVNEEMKDFIKDLNDKMPQPGAAGAAEPNKPVAAPPIPQTPVSIVFIGDVNSVEDMRYRDQVYRKYLSQLTSSGYAEVWSEDMAVGEMTAGKSAEKIRNAQIIIMLVSVDLAGTKKLAQVMPLIAENKNPALKKISVLLRPCLYEEMNGLETFNWLPGKKDETGKIIALNLFAANEQENEMNNIARYITDAVYSIIRQ